MTIYLHVGYPKTATKWMQSQVFSKHPQITFWRNGKWYVDLVTTSDLEFSADSFRAVYETEIGTEITLPVLVSWEELSGQMFVGAWDNKRNADRLQAIFPDARIIFTIRHQVSMIESMYRQYVELGGGLKLDDFIRLRFPSPVLFSLDNLKYDRLIQYYQSKFGRDCVYVCLYEDFKNDPEEFMNGLFGFMGTAPLKLPGDAYRQTVHQSISPAAIHLARFFNRFLYSSRFNSPAAVPARLVKSKQFVKLLKRYLDPFILRRLKVRIMSKKTTSYLEDYYRQSNQNLVQLLDLPLKKCRYPLLEDR